MENLPNWAEAKPIEGQRGLPVYLLLDISSSMEGSPIDALKNGLEQFQNEVVNEPFARDVVKVGIIPYANSAELLNGKLIPIADFQIPTLSAYGVTRLDLAFEVLINSIDRDVVQPVKGSHKGDYKPLIFVLSDGKPTNDQGYPADNWQNVHSRLINRPKGSNKPAGILAVGCGSDSEISDNTLKEISTGLALRAGSDSASFVAVFSYITRSIVSSLTPDSSFDPEDPFANIPVTDDLIIIP